MYYGGISDIELMGDPSFILSCKNAISKSKIEYFRAKLIKEKINWEYEHNEFYSEIGLYKVPKG